VVHASDAAVHDVAEERAEPVGVVRSLTVTGGHRVDGDGADFDATVGSEPAHASPLDAESGNALDDFFGHNDCRLRGRGRDRRQRELVQMVEMVVRDQDQVDAVSVLGSKRRRHQPFGKWAQERVDEHGRAAET
jgi:hypothetical protein